MPRHDPPPAGGVIPPISSYHGPTQFPAMMNLFFRAKPKIPASTTIDIDGAPLTVTVRVNARARSYRLSIPHSGGPLLTLPPHGKWAEAQAFLMRHHNWLAARVKRAAGGARVGGG